MAKAADESNAGKPAVKKSGVAKPPADAADDGESPAPLKKKMTAAEAKKKLKGGGKSDGAGSKVAGAAGGVAADGKKKPVPQLNLPKDLSKQVGLKKDGDADGPLADAAPARPRHDPNIAIHTTNRDARETRKVRSLLVLGGLAAVAVIAALVWLQLRDPSAGGKARLLTLEMDHYRQTLAAKPEIKPVGGKVTAAAVTTALGRALDAQYTAAQPDTKAVATADNPELYSLDLARQFMDPYGHPIRVGLVDGKIVIRSAGPDGVDQTGDQSATAQGDDQVVSE